MGRLEAAPDLEFGSMTCLTRSLKGQEQHVTQLWQIGLSFSGLHSLPPYDLEGLESETSIFPCPVDVGLALDRMIFFSANGKWAEVMC